MSDEVNDRTATERKPHVPRLGAEELARRQERIHALLDSWKTEGDLEEQRETMDVLSKALGENRIASNRKLFP